MEQLKLEFNFCSFIQLSIKYSCMHDFVSSLCHLLANIKEISRVCLAYSPPKLYYLAFVNAGVTGLKLTKLTKSLLMLKG